MGRYPLGYLFFFALKRVYLRKRALMREAMYWTPVSDGKVRCELCPHECLIGEGKAGVCRVRVNRNGRLYSLVDGLLAALHTDPVEKKPLYHFHPGGQILSIGTRGCNLKCAFCQNYHISQEAPSAAGRDLTMSPGELATMAVSLENNTGIAYTYNEPTVFYEFMLETAREIRRAGLKNVAVTNGFISQAPLAELLPEMDAFNVDLKSFDDGFYRRMAGGMLAPVLETLRAIVAGEKHLEITFLVIPTLNDSEEEFLKMIGWISSELGSDIPLHLSRYFPAWKLHLPPTPVPVLERFACLAMEKMRYVYLGNVGETRFSSTFCPACHRELIRREGYQVTTDGLGSGGACRHCGSRLAGIF